MTLSELLQIIDEDQDFEIVEVYSPEEPLYRTFNAGNDVDWEDKDNEQLDNEYGHAYVYTIKAHNDCSEYISEPYITILVDMED